MENDNGFFPAGVPFSPLDFQVANDLNFARNFFGANPCDATYLFIGPGRSEPNTEGSGTLDSGITAVAITPNGTISKFVLRELPEPSVVALLIVGVLIVGFGEWVRAVRGVYDKITGV